MQEVAEDIEARVSGWSSALEELCRFIADNPSIQIDQRSLSVPRAVRAEFYERFDAVRRAFVESKLDRLPEGMAELARLYRELETELQGKTGLSALVLPSSIADFLHQPTEALMRSVQEPLMHVLQGRIGIDDFETQAEQDLEHSAACLFKCAYGLWLACAIVNAFEPVRLYRVEFDAEALPVAVETDTIELGLQPAFPEQRIAEFVLETESGVLCAVKLEHTPEIELYPQPVRKPLDRLHTGNSSGVLGDRVMILQRLESLGWIPLIANRETGAVLSPDLVVEFLGHEDLTTQAGLRGLAKRTSILDPRKGVFVLTHEDEVPPEMSECPLPITVISAGFDRKSVYPIVERLLGGRLDEGQEDEDE